MVLLAFAESIQLFPDGTLFIHIALILLMIWVLNRTFFKPINAIIESREKHKGGRGGEAGEILRDVAEKQKQYEKTMLEARSESYAMIERERAAAVDARQKAISDARAETSALLTKEKEQVKEQIAEAKVEIALEANKMADKITSNILNG
jgi:F-type H+-transporting ATPase subunit b